MWPSEIRDDLRVAIRARQRDDLRTSASYFEKWDHNSVADVARTQTNDTGCRAYGKAVSLPDPEKAFGRHHVMHIASIALALADTLESSGELPKAYSVYQTVFADLRTGLDAAEDPNRRTRAVGTALKMAEIGEDLLDRQRRTGKAPEYGPESEKDVEVALTWALEETLRGGGLKTPAASLDTTQQEQETRRAESLQLPRWVDQVDIVALLERVGSFYAKRGKPE